MILKPVTLEIGGTTLELHYGINQLADVERQMGCGLQEMLAERRVGLDTLRMLLFAGMIKGNAKVTPATAGDLIEKDLRKGASLVEISTAIMQAISESGIFDLLNQTAGGGDSKNVGPSEESPTGSDANRRAAS